MERSRKTRDDYWDVWGDKYPAYEHYAIWAGLVCQHLAIPLQWCDGKHFGEMIGDGNNYPPARYPDAKRQYFPSSYPNNFGQITALQNFLSNAYVNPVEFPSQNGLEDFQIVDRDGNQDTGFKAWGLQSDETLVWIYRSGGYLISNIDGWPEDDFNEGRLSGSEKVKIESTSGADNGKDVTIWGIDPEDIVVSETLTLTDGSATSNRNDWKEVVAVHVQFANAGTITVKGATEGLVVCTIPTGGKDWTAGELIMHDSTTVVQGGPATSAQVYIEEFSHTASGWVVVVGTDDNDVVQREAVRLNGGKGKTTQEFKTCTKLYIGADGATMGMYTVEEDRALMPVLPDLLPDPPPPPSGRRLRVSAPVANGHYVVVWFDTWTGQVLDSDDETATGNQLEFDLPPLPEVTPTRIIGDGTDIVCLIMPD